MAVLSVVQADLLQVLAKVPEELKYPEDWMVFMIGQEQLFQVRLVMEEPLIPELLVAEVAEDIMVEEVLNLEEAEGVLLM
ncbi:hypothetical protein ANAEL_01540 [Anaerolineales bacterium]|nr:hypothetical protein ANAEL_01540 [Anaerolineales bacterium]